MLQCSRLSPVADSKIATNALLVRTYAREKPAPYANEWSDGWRGSEMGGKHGRNGSRAKSRRN